jgi:hypothetical protein
MRDAASEASHLFDDATVEPFLRKYIFQLVDAVLQSMASSTPNHYLRRRHRKHLDYGLKYHWSSKEQLHSCA